MADYQHNHKGPVWYDYYVKVMSQIRHDIKDFSFTKYEGQGELFTMDADVLDILESIANRDEFLL